MVGLAVAVANLDEMIALIRRAPDPATAREEMLAREWPAGDVVPLIELIDEPGRGVSPQGTYRLSDAQARAILELRLHRLTGLERDKIGADLREVTDRIAYYLEVLASRTMLLEILRTELLEMKERFGTPRRTTLMELEFESDVEDLIQREDMVVTVSHSGYIKRVPVSTYRAQKRGGKGRSGMSMKAEDTVNDLFVASTHTPMLFFSSRGMVYKLKVWRLPLGTPQARGKALINLLPLEEGERISTVMPMPEDETTWGDLCVFFATSKGNVRRNKLSDFTNIRANGLIAMKLEEEGEQLIARPHRHRRSGRHAGDPQRQVHPLPGRRHPHLQRPDFHRRARHPAGRWRRGDRHVDAAACRCRCRRARGLSPSGQRRAPGGRGGSSSDEAPDPDAEVSTNIALSPERYDELRGKEEFILTVSERGFGKRTSAYEYRVTGRGGQGIWNIEMNERNGPVVATFPVTDDHQVMLVTDGGQMIRMPIHDVRIAGRKTQGVTLFRVAQGERVVSVAWLTEERSRSRQRQCADGGIAESGDGAAV